MRIVKWMASCMVHGIASTRTSPAANRRGTKRQRLLLDAGDRLQNADEEADEEAGGQRRQRQQQGRVQQIAANLDDLCHRHESVPFLLSPLPRFGGEG